MKNEKLNLKINQGHTNLQILNEFLQMFVSLHHLTVPIEKNLVSFHSNIKAKNIQLVLKKIGPVFGVQLNLKQMEVIENLDIVMKIVLKSVESKISSDAVLNIEKIFLIFEKILYKKDPTERETVGAMMITTIMVVSLMAAIVVVEIRIIVANVIV